MEVDWLRFNRVLQEMTEAGNESLKTVSVKLNINGGTGFFPMVFIMEEHITRLD